VTFLWNGRKGVQPHAAALSSRTHYFRFCQLPCCACMSCIRARSGVALSHKGCCEHYHKTWSQLRLVCNVGGFPGTADTVCSRTYQHALAILQHVLPYHQVRMLNAVPDGTARALQQLPCKMPLLHSKASAPDSQAAAETAAANLPPVSTASSPCDSSRPGTSTHHPSI
jgi:hypothetical protein